MALGIPIYVCATASVPVAAALILKGVSPGAAMVFLMTGPATNAAAITTIWRTMGRRTAVLYLIATAVSALGAGIVLDSDPGREYEETLNKARGLLKAIEVAATEGCEYIRCSNNWDNEAERALLRKCGFALVDVDGEHDEEPCYLAVRPLQNL